MRVAILKDRKRVDETPPAGLKKRFSVTRRTVHGSPWYVLGPLARHDNIRHVLYFHGGAHCMEMTRQHWQFLAELVSITGCVVHVPIYPLAPEHTHRDAFAMLDELYRALVNEVPPESLVFMGDSSGGGFALAYAQRLLDSGRTQPRDILLISPWLDLTMQSSQPLASEIDDPWLDVPGMVSAASWWAGERDVGDPHISPLFGPLSGLGRITLLVGTREILFGDALALLNLAEKEGVEINWIEGNGLIHVWPLLPIAEAIQGRNLIADLLR